MQKEELNKIIETLEKNNSKGTASMGFYYQDGEDEMHLKANPSGLELFAAELLKASRDSEIVSKVENKNYIPFGFKEKWIQGDEMLAYIKPILENRQDIKVNSSKEKSFKDKAFELGCLMIIGILIISTIIGFIAIFKWIFI